MKYAGKELVEITTPQIFTQSKEMLVWDADFIRHNYVPQHATVYAIVKVENHYVAVTNGRNWQHCAEIPTARRATNRELAKWCAQGNGENTDGCWVYQTHAYPKAAENIEVDKNILVRKWEDADWHEPTVDYMSIKDVSNQ